MSLGILFWILVLLSFILGGYERSGHAVGAYWGWGGWLLQFILIVILGWQVFGPFIK